MINYICEHWKRVASLSAFVLLFYFSVCGVLHLQAETDMKYKRCFVSERYAVD
jgi:hypothetical protein